MFKSLLLGVVALSILAGVTRAADPAPLPTAEELHKLYADGDYQTLLARLPRVLALKGQAAAKYDLVDLHLLKADTFVQLKQQPQAINATNDAVKAIHEKTPADSAVRARAQQLLFKQSSGLKYTPKSNRTKPAISLADMSQRKAAYQALFDDMQADVAAKIKAAQSAKALPPIIAAVQGLADMGIVETMATGAAKATAAAGDDLAGTAKRLMTDAVTKMSAEAMAIDQKAKEMIPYGVRDRTVDTGQRDAAGRARQVTVPEATMRMRGLNSIQRDTLKEIYDTCTRVTEVCQAFEQVSQTHADGFRAIATTASKTADGVKETLDFDYTIIYSKSGRY